MSHADPSLRPEAWIEHREFVRVLARRLLADEHAAEDVAQEACIAAFETPPRSHAAARAWLASVVRHLSLNVLRERTRRSRREEAVAREEACEPDVDARIDVQRRVLEAVTALREPYKTAIWMRWYEGLPPREIARRSGVPVETVKSRLKRGLAELQVALDGEFGDRREWMRALAPLALLERPAGVATAWLVGASVCLTIVATWAVANASTPGAQPAARAEVIGAALERAKSVPAARLERASAADRRVAVGVAEPATTDAAGAIRTTMLASTVAADGPRFELEFEPPAGVDRGDFDCSLELDGVVEPVAERQIERVGSGPLPMVQFARAPRTSLLGGGARTTYALTLESRNGLWRAMRHVLATDDDDVRRVRFELDAFAVVAGTVRDRSGAAITAARVRVRDAQGSTVADVPTTNAGHFEIRGIEPGRYDVDGRSLAGSGATSSLALEALERRDLDLVLDPRATTTLEGKLTSRTGRHVPRGVVRLVSVEDPRLTLTTLAVPDPASAAGEWTFRFEGLAPGPYEIVPPMDDAFAWNPPLASVTTPCRAIAFDCRDDVLTTDVALRAVESDTARPIERIRATILLDRYGLGRKRALALEPRALRVDAESGEALFHDVPAGMSGWWLVEADGRLSAWGELSALTRRSGRLETEARLDPAWTAHLWIGTRDEFGDARGLAGARVLTRGGACLAQSLETGDALIDLLFDPGRIQIELPGWRVTSMEGFVNGKLREPRELHRVWMSRD